VHAKRSPLDVFFRQARRRNGRSGGERNKMTKTITIDHCRNRIVHAVQIILRLVGISRSVLLRPTIHEARLRLNVFATLESLYRYLSSQSISASSHGNVCGKVCDRSFLLSKICPQMSSMLNKIHGCKIESDDMPNENSRVVTLRRTRNLHRRTCRLSSTSDQRRFSSRRIERRKRPAPC